MYADKTIRCRDCGMDFVFSAGEQEFYASKGLLNEPQRCQSCRAIAKQNRALGIGTGGGNGGQREMHAAVCAECASCRGTIAPSIAATASTRCAPGPDPPALHTDEGAASAAPFACRTA